MILVDIFNTTSILKHMHILQPFCIAVFLSLFRHNKTPKVFCLTFGVHVKIWLLSLLIILQVQGVVAFRCLQLH